ncbi:MAG: hypothetical protein ABW002_10215, partial [Xanthomonas sp.]
MHEDACAEDVVGAPLADADARAAALRFNATDAAYPSEALLHGLIEAQVRRTPQAPALTFAGQVLDYATL